MYDWNHTPDFSISNLTDGTFIPQRLNFKSHWSLSSDLYEDAWACPQTHSPQGNTSVSWERPQKSSVLRVCLSLRMHTKSLFNPMFVFMRSQKNKNNSLKNTSHWSIGLFTFPILWEMINTLQLGNMLYVLH